MKKMEAYSELQKVGLGFTANVILNQHINAARKLKNLLNLYRKGHEIRHAQSDIDRLVIDGRIYGISVLEAPALVKRWHDCAPVA